MSLIYLIRHGQASFGAADYDHLSELGRVQCELLGQDFARKGVNPDRVISGGLKRQQQSALACAPQADCERDERWNEFDFQHLFACYQAEHNTDIEQHGDLKPLFFDMFMRWRLGEFDHQVPERFDAFRRRVLAALDELKACEDKHIWVFTSGGPIACVIQHLMGLSDNAMLELNWRLVNAGVTKLIANKDGMHISSINEHAIFEGEQDSYLSYR